MLSMYTMELYLFVFFIQFTQITYSVSIYNELDIAINITETDQEPFLCETWIFPSKIQSGEMFSITYKNSNYEQLRPMVLVSSYANWPTLNFSYSTEFTETDIIHPNIFGTRQLTSNCASVFIHVNYGINITNNLISAKYVRPHKDFFIYLGSLELITKLHRNDIQISELRYSYGVETSESGSILHIWNKCQQSNRKRLKFFSRSCDTHIIGRNFQLVGTSILPFLHFEFNTKTGEESPEGILYYLFLETSNRLNFTFDIRYSGYLGSSGFKRDGIWYGAVGEVFRREADIAFGVATTVHRFPINDPSATQLWITRYFYIRSPPYATDWRSIFWPLTPQMWLYILFATLVLVIPVYYICAYLYFKNHRNEEVNWLLLELIDALYRMVMEQSATVRHWKGTRIRLMLFLWTFFCLIISTGYRSKLINFLTFLSQESLPLTHDELSQSDYQLSFRWMGGVAYRYTANSPDPMHKRIMKKSLLVNTSSDGLFQALFAKRGAWLDYGINAEFALQRYATPNPNIGHNPLFVKSIDTDYTCHIIWSFRKGSPWIESFDRILLQILGVGLYGYYQQKDAYQNKVRGAKWLRESNDTRIRDKLEEIMDSLMTGPKPLNNQAVLGLFFILVAGIGAGGISWLIEVSINKILEILERANEKLKSRRATAVFPFEAFTKACT